MNKSSFENRQIATFALAHGGIDSIGPGWDAGSPKSILFFTTISAPAPATSSNMAALTQTCKIVLPARAAARTTRRVRSAVVAKAAAPVAAVRVQQKVSKLRFRRFTAPNDAAAWFRGLQGRGRASTRGRRCVRRFRCVEVASGVGRASVALGTRGIKPDTGLLAFTRELDSRFHVDGRTVDGGCTAADRRRQQQCAAVSIAGATRGCRGALERSCGAVLPALAAAVLASSGSAKPCLEYGLEVSWISRG